MNLPLIDEVLAEVGRATAKFPTWPSDPVHALMVLGEEFGELTKALNEYIYEFPKSTLGDVRDEAIQTAAMTLRFLASFNDYLWVMSAQHEQPMLTKKPRAAHLELSNIEDCRKCGDPIGLNFDGTWLHLDHMNDGHPAASSRNTPQLTPVKHFEDGSATFHARPFDGEMGRGLKEALASLKDGVADERAQSTPEQEARHQAIAREINRQSPVVDLMGALEESLKRAKETRREREGGQS